MTDPVKFWNATAAKYAASPISDPGAYERKLAVTRTYLRPDMAALEFGCGTGGTAISHAPHVASYRALDISENMIDIARAKDGADQVQFEVADFDQVDIAPGSLDAVLGLSILHLVADSTATIGKVFASLKPGGVFVSSTVCLKSAWYLRPVIGIGKALGKVPPVKFLGVDELRAAMTSAGFELVEDWVPEGGFQTLFLVAKKPG
ncbi:class I SAM-dependent methyltransferase [Aliiroseovarius subalbicans]|uniref:class I SAM-dependent methyltransferase n=1 Tax=Aliiroseovarius subalbicans TaxID=2925840 RepID=UPI001F566776|nr:class I SAM-dependent methyltransferase [Aliiroseovarius subalbicans]MCI2400091.1 class I SAM-dependent methyltransferase [Aliiroseovarius subalbicans]